MSLVPREGERMGCHPSPRRGQFITGIPLSTQPRPRAPRISALTLPVSTTGKKSTVSFAASKDIQFTFSQLSVQWLIALCREKDKFNSSLNLSSFSPQLLNDFMLFLFSFSFVFFFFFFLINDIPIIRLFSMQVCRDGDKFLS